MTNNNNEDNDKTNGNNDDDHRHQLLFMLLRISARQEMPEVHHELITNDKRVADAGHQLTHRAIR